MRTSRAVKQDLADAVRRINIQLDYAGREPIKLRNVDGLWGVVDWKGSTLSVLMTKRELLVWLDGFEARGDY